MSRRRRNWVREDHLDHVRKEIVSNCGTLQIKPFIDDERGFLK